MPQPDEPERSARLAQLLDVLKREAPAEARELVLSLAPILFAGMPARIALAMPPELVAARILRLHYPFIAREIPPAHQLKQIHHMPPADNGSMAGARGVH